MPTVEKLIQHVRENYHLLIAERSAEVILEHLDECDQVMVKGRDMVSGLPKAICVPASEIRGLRDGQNGP